MDGILLLDDGTAFPGRGFGHRGTGLGEAVFTTSMVGYQEILTDPSYAGQIVAMTFPHIGNYGVNPEDVESRGPALEGFVVHDLLRRPARGGPTGACRTTCGSIRWWGSPAWTPGPWRGPAGRGGRPGPSSPTTARPSETLREMLAAFPGIDGEDLTSRVTAQAALRLHRRIHGTRRVRQELMSSCRTASTPFRVVALDFGLKENILKNLTARGCQVTVVPAYTPLEEILALRPEGVFLSNGPGNPEMARAALPAIRGLASACPPSASASATSSWPWPSGAGPTSSPSATAGPTTR